MTRHAYGFAYENGGYERTLRTLRARGVDASDAEDLAQAAWQRGWERLDQLRDEPRLVSWIDTIALNLMSRARHRERGMVQFAPEDEPVSTIRIDLSAIDARRALQMVNPHQRGLLRRVYLEGYSNVEIASGLRTSPGAVQGRISRALRAVRRAVTSTVSARQTTWR